MTRTYKQALDIIKSDLKCSLDAITKGLEIGVCLGSILESRFNTIKEVLALIEYHTKDAQEIFQVRSSKMDRTIKEVQIISCVYDDDLASAINEEVKRGWEPFGNIAIDPGYKTNAPQYSMLMVRYE